jgi:hypothetical protein
LAFPRFPQSPSIQSSISNIHDARIYGRSPLTSPVYGEHMNMSGFRTLQHPKTGRTIALATTRSNSPFIPAPIMYPSPLMKQGYVTIPRKPRTGSWAPAVVSELSSSPSSPTTTIEFVEPVYDNLGLRTTAAGSSSLNLNKIASNGKGLTSPGANLKYSMKDRPLPATPSGLMNGGDQISANGSLREPLYSSERKVPPRPPPKPKKSGMLESNPQRITSNGHFEDECEDGTEV